MKKIAYIATVILCTYIHCSQISTGSREESVRSVLSQLCNLKDKRIVELIVNYLKKEDEKRFDYSVITAGPVQFSIGTYNSVPINQSNLLQLAFPIPEKIQKAVGQWLYAHKDLITYITKRRNNLSEWRKEMQENNSMLANKKIRNWSRWNYVLPLSVEQEDDYCIQLSGPLIKRGNIAAFNNTCCDDLPENKINSLVTIPTYQTASRLAHYLRFKEYLAHIKNPKLQTVATYGMSLPWSNSNSVDDENFIVVQKVLASAQTLKESNKPGNLTTDEIYQLFEMVKYVGYWDLTPINLLVKADTLHVIDFEQPGNSNPAHFFQLNWAKYAWNITGAIKEIAKLIKPNSEQYTYFKNLVLNDLLLQQLPFFHMYENFFEIW